MTEWRRKMNRRIKKKIQKRLGYRKYKDYNVAKIVQALHKYYNIRTPDDQFKNLTVLTFPKHNKNNKHLSRAMVLCDCYPISCHTSNEENHVFSVEFSSNPVKPDPPIEEVYEHYANMRKKLEEETCSMQKP